MDFEIRSATPADYDAIARISVEAYRDGGHFAGSAGDYESSVRDAAGRAAHSELLVAVDSDGAVLGSVTVCPPGSEMAEISRDGELEFRMLAVSPQAQGRGVGEALTRACLERGRQLGCRAVAICTRADVALNAQRLYRRLGFERIPERDWSPLPGVELIAWSASL
ncbi:MAG: GNAT family N-acetyltransferase [Stackebrandtia sp.]